MVPLPNTASPRFPAARIDGVQPPCSRAWWPALKDFEEHGMSTFSPVDSRRLTQLRGRSGDTEREDEADLERYGYRQVFARTLHGVDAFSIGCSFSSIPTGIFIGFGRALDPAGPAGIWTWLSALLGQSM